MVKVQLRIPHKAQRQFIDSPAKRKVIRAGRRGGKTTGVSIYAVEEFLKGHRILYAAPTSEQVLKFWWEVTAALEEAIEAKIYLKNETRHTVSVPGTENAIRAKTAWNADSLRGDYADRLILDEYQLMAEDAWGVVGAPMLLDNNGDAVFIYTPPSVRSRSISKAIDKQHAAKLFKKAKADTTGRWETFHFASHENPYISEDALADITLDMTALAYRQEIMAEDRDHVPGALWTPALIDESRYPVGIDPPTMKRIVVAVDPAITSKETSDETGIVVCGIDGDNDGYVLEDCTLRGSPQQWAGAVIAAYYRWNADRVVAEVNQGGDMVENTLRQIDRSVSYKAVHAAKGKYRRAEPVSAQYEKGRVHHVGMFPELEDQMCSWVQGEDSPDRLDALVWAFNDLLIRPQVRVY
jgi:hypothetical protein